MKLPPVMVAMLFLYGPTPDANPLVVVGRRSEALAASVLLAEYKSR
jgi:hypothetical protein